MFNNIQFFYGFQKEYELIANNLTDNCFYYTYENIFFKDKQEEAINYQQYQALIQDKELNEIEEILANISSVSNDRLYLNNTLIYSYNLENISSKLESLLTNKFNQYLLKTNANEQQINSPILINNSLKTNSLEVINNAIIRGNISANNLEYNNDTSLMKIPCSLTIDGNDKARAILTVNQDLIVNGMATLGAVDIQGGTALFQQLNFSNNAKIINLPSYETDNYIYDFKSGILKVNTITANSILVDNKKVSTESENTIKFDNIQIGNIILSEENGNLKITSASMKE